VSSSESTPPERATPSLPSERKFHLVVPQRKERERLDRFLARYLPDYSRSFIQKLIEDQRVLVEGEPRKASHLVSPGQRIDVFVPAPRKLEVEPEDIPLNVMYEDEHLIVIDKPAGLVVHPAFANYSGTLVNALLYHCRNLSGIGGVMRPGIVHRIDKDTSGLLVVAKDDVTHRGLAAQFKAKTVEREYVALVWGVPRPGVGRIETYLGRHPKDRKRIAVLDEGKLAVTHYRVIENLGLLSYVSLRLETGRTHQIRVHMSHIGHPVFGDATYGGRSRKLGALTKRERELAVELLGIMKRQALHARLLGFVHPVTGRKLRFTSELPEDMQQVLERLREEKRVGATRAGT